MALNSRNEHQQPSWHFRTDLFSEVSQSVFIDNTLFFLFGAVASAGVAIVRAGRFWPGSLSPVLCKLNPASSTGSVPTLALSLMFLQWPSFPERDSLICSPQGEFGLSALLAPLSRDQPGILGKPNSGSTSALAMPLHSGWRHGAGCTWLTRPWDEYRNGGEARRNFVPIGQSNLLNQKTWCFVWAFFFISFVYQFIFITFYKKSYLQWIGN